ncbi:FxsA family protein [Actibacterium sp. XHP0104]|uniref:FxsA family protein n=1 Tax=Actibacterium sp. XHP0104 TaxID=2984335 RepID=UPI0021E7504C|nr:FxsA family protein [Actibacterium sp. XHP0104]MCV2882110.1 FxsA family protein [Actibacterium sp. XHP0104]
MWLLALFLAVPLIEIALFVQVGGAIGLWPTLGIVVLTAIAGTTLMRAQGALAMGQIRGSFEQMSDPTEPLAHGAMILIAGVLLLTPGFFTDTVGILLLIPGNRAMAFRWIKSRIHIQTFTTAQPPHRHPGQQPDDVIDGEFQDVTPADDASRLPSGWTRH